MSRRMTSHKKGPPAEPAGLDFAVVSRESELRQEPRIV